MFNLMRVLIAALFLFGNIGAPAGLEAQGSEMQYKAEKKKKKKKKEPPKKGCKCGR